MPINNPIKIFCYRIIIIIAIPFLHTFSPFMFVTILITCIECCFISIKILNNKPFLKCLQLTITSQRTMFEVQRQLCTSLIITYDVPDSLRIHVIMRQQRTHTTDKRSIFNPGQLQTHT